MTLIYLDLRKIVPCSNNKYHTRFIKSIHLTKYYFSFVPKKNKSVEKNDTSEYCVQFSTIENLLDELNEDHLILNLQICS